MDDEDEANKKIGSKVRMFVKFNNTFLASGGKVIYDKCSEVLLTKVYLDGSICSFHFISQQFGPVESRSDLQFTVALKETGCCSYMNI